MTRCGGGVVVVRWHDPAAGGPPAAWGVAAETSERADWWDGAAGGGGAVAWDFLARVAYVVRCVWAHGRMEAAGTGLLAEHVPSSRVEGLRPWAGEEAAAVWDTAQWLLRDRDAAPRMHPSDFRLPARIARALAGYLQSAAATVRARAARAYSAAQPTPPPRGLRFAALPPLRPSAPAPRCECAACGATRELVATWFELRRLGQIMWPTGEDKEALGRARAGHAAAKRRAAVAVRALRPPPPCAWPEGAVPAAWLAALAPAAAPAVAGLRYRRAPPRWRMALEYALVIARARLAPAPTFDGGLFD